MITGRKQNGVCRPEIEIAFDRNNIFVKFQGYTYIFGGAQSKEPMSDTDR